MHQYINLQFVMISTVDRRKSATLVKIYTQSRGRGLVHLRDQKNSIISVCFGDHFPPFVSKTN